MAGPSRSQASRTVASPCSHTTAMTSRSSEPRLRSRKSRDDLKPQKRKRRIRKCVLYGAARNRASTFDFLGLEAFEGPPLVEQRALDHGVPLEGGHRVVEAFDGDAGRVPRRLDPKLVGRL